MNRRLRIRHRWLTTALAFAVPFGLAAAILVRPTIPVMTQLPDFGERQVAGDYTAMVASEDTQLDGARMRFELKRAASVPERYAVVIRPYPGEAVPAADVLVYWTDAATDAVDSVPTGAQLLGTLAGTQTRRFVLPAAVRPGSGRLVFFSLGQRRLLEGSWTLPVAEPLP